MSGKLTTDFDEFMTTEEIARLLKKNIATIQRWCRDGEMPAARLGRSYMVRKQDFETWFKTKMYDHKPSVKDG